MAVDHLFAQFIIDAKNKRNQGQNEVDEEQVKSELLELAEQLKSNEISAQIEAIEKLRVHSRKQSANISQVPSFIKYLYDKVDDFKKIYNSWPDEYEHKLDLANLISFLSMIDNRNFDVLRYRLYGRQDALDLYGLEYAHHLSEDVKNVYETPEPHPFVTDYVNELLDYAREICQFYLKNNCEIDVVDLTYELDNYELLEDLIDERNIVKILNYLQQLALYTIGDDFYEAMRFAIRTYRKFNMTSHALIASCKILDIELMHEIILKVTDEPLLHELNQEEARILQLQLCLILGHYGMYPYFSDITETLTRSDCEPLINIIHNRYLIDAHSKLAVELDILKPYSPDDVFKITGHKFNAYYSAAYLSDPSLLNLASAMVSALTNAAFKTDTLLLDGTMSWLSGQKEYALLSCVASIGLLYMWDIEEVMLVADKFINSQDKFVKAGGILAIGIASANVFDRFDSNLAVILDCLNESEILIQRCSIMSLGLAFSGTDDRDVVDYLKPFLTSRSDNQSRGLASLAIGMICVATYVPATLANDFVDCITSIPTDKLTLSDQWMRLIPIGLGLTFMYRNEHLSPEVKALANLPGEYGRWCSIIIKICSNVGNGDTFIVQKLMKYFYVVPKSDEKTTALRAPVFEKNRVSDIEKALSQNLTGVGEIIDKPDTTEKSEKANEEIDVTSTPISKANDTLSDSKPFPIDPFPNIDVKPVPSISESKVTETISIPSKSAASLKSNIKKEFKKLRDSINMETEMVQGLATIGIALVSMSDDICKKMAVRLINNLLQFGTIGVRRAVPIALSIMFASIPEVGTIELLSKLSHDQDIVVSANAIIGLGVVSAGTNNSRVSHLLKNLNIYFYRDPAHLIAIRLAQGLLHLSKGVMSLSPGRAENTILSPTAIASLLIHSVLSLDVSTNYLTLDTRMFYWLVPAMKLRALITYDENFNIVPVTVRVGEAVEEVGQAGKPKKITGFQTVKTPILLDAKDKVELATDKYVPLTHILENIVIVKKSDITNSFD